MYRDSTQFTHRKGKAGQWGQEEQPRLTKDAEAPQRTTQLLDDAVHPRGPWRRDRRGPRRPMAFQLEKP